MASTSDASQSQPPSQTPKTGILNMCGTKIGFPSDLRPYKSQLGLMAKAVNGVKKAQNCLLESPTGSGKTMAMLCSLLAWQKTLLDEEAEIQRVYKEQLKAQRVEYYDIDQLPLTPVVTKPNEEKDVPVTPVTDRMKFMEEWSPPSSLAESTGPTVKNKANTSRCISPDLFADDDDDMDAFKPPKKKKQCKLSHCDEKIVVDLQNSPAQSPVIAKDIKVEITSPTIPVQPTIKPPLKMKIPKIYYATRTHKQIAQVVSELRRTPYKDTRMTVLSSREHSCIHKLIHPYPSKTEMCHALLDGGSNPDPEEGEEMQPRNKLGCTFKSKLDKLISAKPYILDYLEVSTPWDIEDIVQGGKNKKCCPYYASRGLMSVANIVFCPYNYIIDPLIRASMGISLKDNIVVFDEAHNIEDSIRSATSYSLEEKNLNEAIKTCQIALYQGAHRAAYTEVKKVLEILLAWMKESSEYLKVQDNMSKERSCIYIGTQYVAHMENKGIGASHFPNFKAAADLILTGEAGSNPSSQEDDEEEEESERNNAPKIESIYKPNQAFKNVVQGLCLIWNYMYKDDSKNRDDYYIVLYETTTRYFAKEHSNEQADGGWVRRAAISAQLQLGLHFWCMNPGLGFADFQETHSVIVTSGTLSPMASFQSELGVLFPHPLSADHVIDPSQAWVATISVGPSNKLINGTYRNAVTLEYQDEIGSAILKICQAVPFGILCFFPSYATLDKVMQRWQLTGKWNELLRCKYVIKEPRTQSEFLEAMTDFDLAVKRAEHDEENGVLGSSQTGALFLAVFRGKLSEGIDFKDNHARAVITVSIPFPSMSDLNVKLKKKFNDKNNLVNKSLLPGNQWYEIQAYRAINQALGRCIRHRNDWGAIIMLDDRFTPNGKATSSLSKWATKQIRHFQNWNSMYTMLQEFIQTRLAIQKGTASVKGEVIIDLT